MDVSIAASFLCQQNRWLPSSSMENGMALLLFDANNSCFQFVFVSDLFFIWIFSWLPFSISQPLVRVTVPRSAVSSERRTFTLNLPRNAQSVVVVPHAFYSRYQRRLGNKLIFVDQHGDTHQMTLHKGRFF
ncbi:hypothetical protein PIB30_068205 [Stylosanthes scabra]|uniref:Uncharacterized protein n=1 Tax=Stylosanthes scabra TaxID=79078 RepID=A0ABU6RN14_9FABA|nr:hypothetical protein [Stylosanthes scabra]